MNEDEFRKAGHDAIERIIAYHKSLNATPPATSSSAPQVLSQVSPGYLASNISTAFPEHGVSFAEIQKDFEQAILPGITHWQSPNFMAYFPANSSFPAILGDMYSDMVTCAAFNWQASPAVTELETIVLDMLADALSLDPGFKSHGTGGGVIFGSASEASLTMMIAARDRYLESSEDSVPIERLVVIVSDQTHSGIEKAAKLLRVRCHKITTKKEDDYGMTGEALALALSHLRSENLHPFFIGLTLGTTATCAIDHFQSIEPLLSESDNQPIWSHLDAAYAGTAMILPHLQHHLQYTHTFDSFVTNPHKWLLTNFDCTTTWLKNRNFLTKAMDMTPEYLKNKHSESGLVVDYRNWGIPLGRRFRALKLWFVIRSYGLSGCRAHIQRHLDYSDVFVDLVNRNPDMTIIGTPRFALCVLRFATDRVTRLVHEKITREGKLFLTGTVVGGEFVIRVVGAAPDVREEHLVGAYRVLVDAHEIVKADLEKSEKNEKRLEEEEEE